MAVEDRQATDLAARFDRLPMPARFAAEGEPIREFLRPRQRDPAHAEASIDRLAGAYARVERLEREAFSPEEREYANAARTLVDERVSNSERVYERSRDAAGVFQEFLTSVAPPERRRTLQSTLEELADGYREFIAARQTALRDRDLEMLRASAAESAGWAERLRSASAELGAANPLRSDGGERLDDR
jgi:hypothetical protein